MRAWPPPLPGSCGCWDRPPPVRIRACFSTGTGKSWTRSAIPAKVSGSSEPFIVSYTPAYDGHGGIWAGPYAHWTGTRWRNTYQVASLPGKDTFALLAVASIPGSASVWAAGWAGRSPSNNTQDSLIAVYGGLP